MALLIFAIYVLGVITTFLFVVGVNKTNKYFITYFYKTDTGNFGFGNLSITNPKKIETYADIDYIKSFIEKDIKQKDVVIFSYKKIK